MRKVKLFIVTAILSTVMSMTALAGEWKQDNIGWWYQNDDGSYPINTWIEDGYYWYHFNPDGYMQTGWIQLDDGWYNFRDDGSCSNMFDITGKPVGAPGEGWISYSTGSAATLADDLVHGRVVKYNGMYWIGPDYVDNEDITYEHDIANESLSDRYSLADMQFN